MIEKKETEKDKEVEQLILMLEDPSKKKILDLGRVMFPNSAQKQVEERLGQKIEKEAIEAELEALRKGYKYVFSEEDLIKEIKEYGLNFKCAIHYTGKLDYHYLEAIEAFIVKNAITTQRADYQHKFYTLHSFFNKKNPLLFYKHTQSGGRQDYYVMIEGDKSYVNPLNYLIGFLNFNRVTHTIGMTMIVMLVVALLFSPFEMIFTFNAFYGVLVGAIIGLVCLFIFGAASENYIKEIKID